MYFDYAGYVRECLNFPLANLIFFDVLSTLVAIIVWIKMKRTLRTFPGIRLLILIAVLSTIDHTCMLIGQLSHGGIYLLREKESDAVEMKGEITEITGLNDYSLPIIECDYYENMKYGDPNGYEFTINGIQCTAPVKGSLKLGDYVSVTYLPKSGYILYIDKVEP